MGYEVYKRTVNGWECPCNTKYPTLHEAKKKVEFSWRNEKFIVSPKDTGIDKDIKILIKEIK